MSDSNTKELPEKHTTHPPPPSLSSSPDEIVLRCLTYVPRSYHLNISWVSKHLRTLVLSPELNTLRSSLHKNSLYVCFQDDNTSTFHWLTLRPNNETTPKTTSYRLVPNPTPFPSHKYDSLTVVMGSNIFFIGGSGKKHSTDLWILDIQSGNLTQGPSMTAARDVEEAAVGVIDGKIYVIGGGGYSREETQVEVFDPKLETWELAGLEKVGKIPRFSGYVEGKVYMVEYEKTTVYNPRECEGERLVPMVSERLEGGRKEMLSDTVGRVCVVEDVLFACFNRSGVMWFDTKLNVWRRLVGRDGKEMFIFHVEAMGEYDGKLVVLYMWGESKVDDIVTKSVRCKVVSLHRAGGRICGTVDWSGVVGTVPCSFCFLHCLAVSE